MAFPRRSGGNFLSAPRLLTFVVSIVLAGLALVSLRLHLPSGLSFVNTHRFWMLAAGYVVLLIGVILPGV
jgi:predicted membrane channel-forming protein YqfA (hemolysin III family)